MKKLNWNVFKLILFVVLANAPINANTEEHSIRSSIECQDQNSKSQRLANLIAAKPEQCDQLNVVCDYIDTHWNELMHDAGDDKKVFFQEIIFNEKTAMTVHPAAEEVCIYLEGHTELLGEGAFKKVVKGVTYRSESEVAVAFPRGCGLTMYSYETELDILLNDFFLDHESQHSLFLQLDKNEAIILEKVQACRGVTEVFFISYSQNNDDLRPLIVQKYYNGGTLAVLNLVDDHEVNRIILICHDLIMALNDIHEIKIAHKDLHRNNVLLQKNSEIKEVTGAVIADFGLSIDLTAESEQYKIDFLNKDLLSLASDFKDIITSSEHECSPLLERISQLIDFHANAKNSSKVLYEDFITMISAELSEEEFNYVTKNSIRKRRLKFKKGNTIMWR